MGGAPFRRALWAQLVGLLVAVLVTGLWPNLPGWAAPIAHGLCAAALAVLWRLPRWWWWISLGFAPLAWVGQAVSHSLGLPAWVWLLAFMVVFLVFWRTDASRVPLYMTNSRSAEAVSALLGPASGQFIDLGCGDGRLLRHLARERPDWHFVGFEHAPLTWAWAKVLGLRLPNLQVHLGSFWDHPLAPYDVVYAFLSPVPMPRLWDKARGQLQPGARLVSNSFEIPGVTPAMRVDVDDARKTRLLVYIPSAR